MEFIFHYADRLRTPAVIFAMSKETNNIEIKY